METLSKDAEQQIIGAVEKTASYVSGGLTPTDALVKAARDCRLPAGFVPLVARAYNVAATNQQRESSTSLFDKVATIPLANSDAALDQLFPSIQKSAAEQNRSDVFSPEYRLPPYFLRYKHDTVKSASASSYTNTPAEDEKPLDVWVADRRHAKTAFDLRQAAIHARAVAAQNLDNTVEAFARLKEACQKSAADLPNIVKIAGQIEPASVMVALAFGTVGVSTLKAASNRLISRDEPVLRLARDADTASRSYLEKLAEAEMAQGALATCRELPKPPQMEEEEESDSVLPMAKAADLTSGAMGGLAAATLKHVAPDPAKAYDKTLASLSDPAHEAALRNIRTQAMLHGLMMHDPVLKGHRPEEVLQAYNELASAAPRIADQTVAVQPLLRKRLTQGGLDSFDVDQLYGMDTKLQKRDAQEAYNGGSVL